MKSDYLRNVVILTIYVIVRTARHRKNPGKDIFFRDTMIRSESNYVIVIFARHKKILGKIYFFVVR